MALSDIKAGRAYVEIFTKDAYTQGLKEAQTKLRAFSATVSKIGAGFVALGSLGTGAAIQSILQYTRIGDALDKMSKRTGVSVEALSALRHAAVLGGTDLQTLESAIRRMQRSIANADGHTFDALGLSLAQLRALSPDEQFVLIAERMAAVADEAQRTALAIQFMGRSGTAILPLFAEGAGAFVQVREEAQRLNLVFSQESARAAAELEDALSTVKAQVAALAFAYGAQLAPTLLQGLGVLSDVLTTLTGLINEHETLAKAVAFVSVGFAALGTVLLATAAASWAAATGMAALDAALVVLQSRLGIIGLVILAVGALAVWLANKFSWFGQSAKDAIAEVRGELQGFQRDLQDWSEDDWWMAFHGWDPDAMRQAFRRSPAGRFEDRVSTIGTFDPNAVAGLTGARTLDGILRECKRIADHTESLDDLNTAGGVLLE